MVAIILYNNFGSTIIKFNKIQMFYWTLTITFLSGMIIASSSIHKTALVKLSTKLSPNERYAGWRNLEGSDSTPYGNGNTIILSTNLHKTGTLQPILKEQF